MLFEVRLVSYIHLIKYFFNAPEQPYKKKE